MTDSRINFFIFDNIDQFLCSFTLTADEYEESVETDETSVNCKNSLTKYDITLKADGYFLSVFQNVLNSSNTYRRLVVRNIQKSCGRIIPKDREIFIKVVLDFPKRDVIDYEWNDRMTNLIWERQELDHAMSWLSTLGGAFSALGDSFEHCAKKAGTISIKQFEIALRLGDPPLAARCRLYMALSLIQQDKLKVSKRIVKEQYEIAKNYKDVRLQNMCKGVWAKLQYMYELKKLEKIKK